VSYGRPRRGAPDGVSAVKYKVPGSKTKVLYKNLTPAERENPCIKYYTVPMEETPPEARPGDSPEFEETKRHWRIRSTLYKAERKAQKELLTLKPCEYFAKSSDTTLSVRTRSALQIVKPCLQAVDNVYNESLKDLRGGVRSSAKRRLHAFMHSMRACEILSHCERLVFRYTQWVCREIGAAKRVLGALGHWPDVLRDRTLCDYGRSAAKPRRLFVLPKEGEYSTGLALPPTL